MRDIAKKKTKAKPCKVHVLLVDFNDEGQLFRVTIEGNKEEILSYFYDLSNDVRFVKTANKHRNDKGCRVLPCGIVRACTWECNKYDTFSNYKSKYHDARKAVIA